MIVKLSLITRLLACVSLLLFVLLMPFEVRAAVISVPASDENALIAAIDDANSNQEDDVIELGGGLYEIQLVNNVMTGKNGLPTINSRVDFVGNDSIIQRESESEDFRLLEIESNGFLSLSNVTIRQGRSTDRRFEGGVQFSTEAC